MSPRVLLMSIALSLILVLALLPARTLANPKGLQVLAAGSIGPAFDQASQEFGVPSSLLKVLCYMEGRLSNHGGSPSIDGGYGCTHLVKNQATDTLDRAALDLGVSTQQLKLDMKTTIRGTAAVLRDYAVHLSRTHRMPTKLADWYGALAAYSAATTRSTALLYADSVYKLLNSGFSAQTQSGETITLAQEAVKPNTATASTVHFATGVPAGCTNDGNVDYPGALDCILDPKSYDCNLLPPTAPCNYQDANRPHDFTISQVVIHDIEGTAQNALNAFQNPKGGVSVQYIVDSDGTVYQVVHEKDIAYHAGNLWYNEHAVGIEHAGFAATGFLWYNATEYLASAQLTAYLLKKYSLPLDHAHVLAHGTIPSPLLATTPNHVDPGPYWLWDYYLKLIHQQGVPFPANENQSHIITLHPRTDRRPFGGNGTETAANFNFFYLYTGPSSASGLIPQEGNGSDVTDETDNVEPAMSYYYLAKVEDPAGTGETMYEIWYGEEDHAHDPQPSLFAHGQLAWLAVLSGAAVEGQGTIVALSETQGQLPQISGSPTTGSQYYIGDAPNGALFVSTDTVIEDGTTNLWYEINYNHRQAWIPASEVTMVHALGEPGNR
jgi:hypothetical protein